MSCVILLVVVSVVVVVVIIIIVISTNMSHILSSVKQHLVDVKAVEVNSCLP